MSVDDLVVGDSMADIVVHTVVCVVDSGDAQVENTVVRTTVRLVVVGKAVNLPLPMAYASLWQLLKTVWTILPSRLQQYKQQRCSPR